MLDYVSPFTFLFRDRDWLKKFLLASLLTYTLIGADPVTGWMVEVARRVSSGNPAALPEWEDWKSLWKQGAKFLAVNLLWLLPLVLALIIIYLPLLLINRLPDTTLLVLWAGTFFCVLIFLLLYSIVYGFFLPAMVVRLVETGRVWDSTNPASLWETVRPHFSQYLLVFLIVSLGLVNVILILSAFTFFLLLPPLLVYLGLVSAHFAGQLSQPGQ